MKRRLKEHRMAWRERFAHRLLIEDLSRKAAFAAEIEHIAYYPTVGKRLRNLHPGGRGCREILQSTRDKLSAAGKGRRKPAGFGEKVSKAQKGKPKEFSPLGREAVKRTQFRKGHRNTPEQRAKIEEAARRQWLDIPAKERSRRATQRNIAAWSKRDETARKVIGQNIRAGQMASMSSEERSLMASRAARAAVAADPEVFSKRTSSQVKGWWASLTPESKAEFIAKRAVKIAEAKARKKASVVI